MKLEVEGKSVVSNPTIQQIRESLINVGTTKHSFAILTNDFGDFLQTTGDNDKGFILEFWEKKNKKNYYKTSSDKHQIDIVVNSFISFAENPILSSVKLDWEMVSKEVGEENSKLVNAFYFLFFFNLINLISIEAVYRLVISIVVLIGWVVFIKIFGAELWRPIRENKSIYQNKSYQYILGVIFSVIAVLFSIIIALQNQSA
jgi:hypothetical protein